MSREPAFLKPPESLENTVVPERDLLKNWNGGEEKVEKRYFWFRSARPVK